MKTTRVLLIVLVLAIASAALVSAKTVEEAISEYRFKNDTSADYATVTIENKTYYFVRFNDNLSIVLDKNLSAVSSEETLASLVKTFYENTGKLGFSENTAASMNVSFSTAFDAFKGCNKTFFDHVEDNFIWRDFRCVEFNTGIMCEIGFNYRKNLSANFLSLKAKIDGLTTGWTSMQPDALIQTLTQVRDLSDTVRVDANNWNAIYKYFRGDWMKDDAACGYDNNHVTQVNVYAKDAVAKGVMDISGEAAMLAKEYQRRQGAAKIKEIQNNAKALVDEGLKLVELLDRDLSLGALRQPYD